MRNTPWAKRGGKECSDGYVREREERVCENLRMRNEEKKKVKTGRRMSYLYENLSSVAECMDSWVSTQNTQKKKRKKSAHIRNKVRSDNRHISISRLFPPSPFIPI